MPATDKTPAEIFQEAIDALENLVKHSAAIAHTKKAFYDAYIAEGFTPEQALELCKSVTSW